MSTAANAVQRIYAVDLDHVHELVSQRWSTLAPRLMSELLRAAPRPAGRPAEILGPREAHTYLEQLRAYAEDVAVKRAQAMSAAEWLWYLRRMPIEPFAGRLRSTEPYDRALAETIGGFSTKPSPAPTLDNRADLPGLTFPVTANRIDRVLRLYATAIFLSDVHTKLRRAAKGQSFQIDRTELVLRIDDPGLEHAIALYDKRGHRGGHRWARSGTPMLFDSPPEVVADLLDPERNPAFLDLLTVEGTGKWTWLPGHRKIGDSVWKGEVSGRWIPRFQRLADRQYDILRLPEVRASRWWSPELPSLVLLAHLAARAVLQSESGPINVVRYGYLVVSPEAFTEYCASVLPHCVDRLEELFDAAGLRAGTSLLESVSVIGGSLWPLEVGPLIRPMGDHTYLIDIAGVTERIAGLLAVGREGGGSLPNQRADHYENAVQEMIDCTQHAPPTHLHRLRGKTLRLNGKAVTDIDAIAMVNDTLLLVSCKSRPYTPYYDRGDYGTVLNAARQIDRDVADWEDKVGRFSTGPIGDNYDFSSAATIVGVVCTPFAVFTTSQTCLKSALVIGSAHLRRSCSFSELQHFLTKAAGQNVHS